MGFEPQSRSRSRWYTGASASDEGHDVVDVDVHTLALAVYDAVADLDDAVDYADQGDVVVMNPSSPIDQISSCSDYFYDCSTCQACQACRIDPQ